jgi:extracellular matrix regulatory protein A
MFVMVGHENYVNSDLISVILKPDSSPVKRLRQSAEENGMLLNASSGHKTRSVIVLSSGQVVLSSLQPMAVNKRIDDLSRSRI